jgi:hypothetical protein
MFVCWKIEMSKTQAFPAGKLECINTVSTSWNGFVYLLKGI